MPGLDEELVVLIIQFLNEEGFKETARVLERESGFHFEMKDFEKMVLDGDWDGAERYLSGFTKFNDNRYSTKIYFEIRKHKFLEALDKNERAKALDILVEELKVFSPGHEELYMEMTLLLSLDDIREHPSLSAYGDTDSARRILMMQLQKLIESNPVFHNKLKLPSITVHRLRRLINQGLNWQHALCAYPEPNPSVRTLFVDHVCGEPDDSSCSASSSNFPPPSQTTEMTVLNGSACTISTLSTASYSAKTGGENCFGNPTKLDATAGSSDSNREHVQTTNEHELALSMLIQNSSTIFDRMAIVTGPDKNSVNIAVELSTVNCPGQSTFSTHDGLPKSCLLRNTFERHGLISNLEFPMTLARILEEGSSPTSIDFHPDQHAILLVGTNTGEIGLWEVISGKKLLSRNFEVWDIGACSFTFQASMLKDPRVSVKRVTWSPDGSLFGVAYSKHIAQIYSFHGGNDVQWELEIDAHVGGVNDIAFCVPEKQLWVITCGDDKSIKVWEVTSGDKLFCFDGHTAPVYSLCPHSKGNVHFFFSTSEDGTIKAWLYDNIGARVDIDAPGLGCTLMAYGGTGDDRRLFSCGTNQSGQSFLAEWDEGEGVIKRTYQGLQKNSSAVLQFDILKNRYLVVGDEHLIKVWDVEKVELLTSIDADGGLHENSLVRFNKAGTLLAVLAKENTIKILATNDGLQLLDKSENCSVDTSGFLSEALRKPVANLSSAVGCAGVAHEGVLQNEEPKSLDVLRDKFTGNGNIAKGKNVSEIISACPTLLLTSCVETKKISRLSYNNAGNAILALASNGVHLFWKWPLNDPNMSGKATINVPPQLWQPRSCTGPMTNDIAGTNPEETLPCFAVSKNDSYLLSASGGKISLFNMMTFKTMLSLMRPPPATTSLAFHPQDNNIVAIGRDDGTIIVYNIRIAKVISKLEGHSARVSGLAFSDAMNVLISSGADSQINVWNAEMWIKDRSTFTQNAYGTKPAALSDTSVQFHRDQTQFLAVQESYLAIYEAKSLECRKKWVPVDFAHISRATYSCDGQMLFVGFMDGTISIFDALNLEERCRIVSTAYLPPSSSLDVYPMAIAANPQKPDQFAVGLSDGGVIIVEPRSYADKWGMLPPDQNGSSNKMPVGSNGPSQS